jgi:methionyl-tRNA formyltransferase
LQITRTATSVGFGDRIAGTIYWIDDSLDTGPIAARRAVHVMPGDTAAALWRRALAPIGIELFSEVMEKLERGETPPRKKTGLSTFQVSTPSQIMVVLRSL